MFGISKSSVETIIRRVSIIMSMKLRADFISMPINPRDLAEAKIDFIQQSNFPMCIAAVDGTHVLIQSFGGLDAEIYQNRKTVFSLNVQIASSADVIFFFELNFE